MSTSRDRLLDSLKRIAANSRLQGEAGWVMATKLIEFAILFVLLKLLTNALGAQGYGEYNLAETALVLVTHALLAPIRESYMRDYHGAAERGESRAAGAILVRWYAIATLAVAGAAALLSATIAEHLHFGRWTALAWGVLFLFDRWRFMALELLNLRRQRRRWATYTIAFQLTLVVSIYSALQIGPRTPATALLGYAFASFVFAVLVAGPMVGDLRRQTPGNASHLLSMATSFGIPFSALLVFQWVQGFSDRYLLKALLDAQTVGIYVAAYQVCGIPYSLLLRMSHNLLVPIAYQRGHDAQDASRLWAADKVLLAGIAVQAAVGGAMLVLYFFFGQRLIVLVTNESFVVSSGMVVALAAGRYVQALSQATQPIFAVHQRMKGMLWLRVFGAAVTVAVCIPMIRAFGAFGAAVGSLSAISIYLIVLWAGPSGALWLIRSARGGEGRRLGA